MNTLDQRILIPASPDVVWTYISNLSNNPSWQADCRSISFLTSYHSGQGTRWRYSNDSGRDMVVEITTWYDRLGYEYRIVDGAPYRENRGRVRLQEIPEGTVVQWTFSYELGGMLGGLRNSLSTKRHIESTMTDSLRKLYRAIGQFVGEHLHEAKSLMRDAPDVYARSQYKPRHPSVMAEKQVEQPSPPANAAQPPAVPPPGLVIPEPPVSEEDTRPRRPVVISGPAEATPLPEPDFLADMPTTEHPAAPVIEPVKAPEDEPAPEPIAKPVVPAVEEDMNLPPVPVSTLDWKGAQQTQEEIPAPPIAWGKNDDEVMPPSSAPSKPTPPGQQTKVDTGTVSVFEVFGLPKPSETQEMKALQTIPVAEPAVQAGDTHPTMIVSQTELLYPKRLGRRIALRRKRVKLRYF